MQVYTEILPPTGVTHAVKLSFLGPKTHNLVVAKTSLLQVFETRLVDAFPSDQRANFTTSRSQNGAYSAQSESGPGQAHMKLVLVGEYSLSGIVTSLVAVKTVNSKTGGHALLISFKDAKLSLVEWNPATHGLSTISIHYYEDEDLQFTPWAPELGKSPTSLIVDPNSKCAALQFCERHLAILPFRQAGYDLVTEVANANADGVKPQVKGKIDLRQTPYASSFVLALTALDSSMMHPVDVAFLYEFQEPTLGVLSSARYPTTYFNPERKDSLSYTVFTLDLEQRARTPLLIVPNLPYDLHKIVPLPLPNGGSLLVGGNEIIHVDQSGKTIAVAVNEFAKECSSFPMADQSDLALKLEGCVIEQLNRSTGEILIILNTGEMAMLVFEIDGRSVSGVSVQRVPKERGGDLLVAAASCAVALGQGTVFVGSDLTDSVIMGYKRKGSQLSRKRSYGEMLGQDYDVPDVSDEDCEKVEDDLYGKDNAPSHEVITASPTTGLFENISFSLHDTLMNLCASGEPILGRSSDSDSLELALPVGANQAGGVAFLKHQIQPNIIQSAGADHVADLWALKPLKEVKDGSPATPPEDSAAGGASHYDQILITSGKRDGKEKSSMFTITATGLEPCLVTDFEEDSITLNAGLLCNGSRIVQVTLGDIRCYGPDLGLTQIIPISDEDAETDPKITHSSFADPYLLILRDDSSVTILKAEDNGDVEELDKDNILGTKNRWVSGSLCKSPNTSSQILAYMLSVEGALHVFELPNLNKAIYIAGNFKNLPFILSTEAAPRRSAKVDPLVEILVCELGDRTTNQLHLIVRNASHDITIYKPFHFPRIGSGHPFTENLRWRKVPGVVTLPPSEIETNVHQRALRVVDFGEYKAVMWPGDPAYCVVKEAASLPRLMRIRSNHSPVITGFNSKICPKGLAMIDDSGSVQLYRIPTSTRFGQTGWSVDRLDLGETVEGLAYHPETGHYVVALNERTDFALPEDDWHQEWANEGKFTTHKLREQSLKILDLSLKPESSRGIVKLLSPKSGSVVHEYPLLEDETILCIKALNLEVSEKTHERRTLIAVGTGLIQGEDLPSNGTIYIFDVIRVAPEVDRPETGMALKLIAREETRGAVTALSEIGDEGFLLCALGQKCMVRGLKEDNTLLPVAFLDMQCYIPAIKNVKGTGLALMADAVKGLWFTGYFTDPYGLRLFGKTATDLNVVVAEFLPWQKQLFILVADADCYLHVLEYNPENPKSLNGQRLIPKSVFHAGHFPAAMTLLPMTASSTASTETENGDAAMKDSDDVPTSRLPQILMTMQSGALVLVTQLDETTYRRLGALQTYLIGILEHFCGLNPRAYRDVDSEGFGGRGILDGSILTRFSELGSQKKVEACGRAGAEIWQLQMDMDLINGGGLYYL